MRNILSNPKSMTGRDSNDAGSPKKTRVCKQVTRKERNRKTSVSSSKPHIDTLRSEEPDTEDELVRAQSGQEFDAPKRETSKYSVFDETLPLNGQYDNQTFALARSLEYGGRDAFCKAYRRIACVALSVTLVVCGGVALMRNQTESVDEYNASHPNVGSGLQLKTSHSGHAGHSGHNNNAMSVEEDGDIHAENEVDNNNVADDIVDLTDSAAAGIPSNPHVHSGLTIFDKAERLIKHGTIFWLSPFIAPTGTSWMEMHPEAIRVHDESMHEKIALKSQLSDQAKSGMKLKYTLGNSGGYWVNGVWYPYNNNDGGWSNGVTCWEGFLIALGSIFVVFTGIALILCCCAACHENRHRHEAYPEGNYSGGSDQAVYSAPSDAGNSHPGSGSSNLVENFAGNSLNLSMNHLASPTHEKSKYERVEDMGRNAKQIMEEYPLALLFFALGMLALIFICAQGYWFTNKRKTEEQLAQECLGRNEVRLVNGQLHTTDDEKSCLLSGNDERSPINNKSATLSEAPTKPKEPPHISIDNHDFLSRMSCHLPLSVLIFFTGICFLPAIIQKDLHWFWIAFIAFHVIGIATTLVLAIGGVVGSWHIKRAMSVDWTNSWVEYKEELRLQNPEKHDLLENSMIHICMIPNYKEQEDQLSEVIDTLAASYMAQQGKMAVCLCMESREEEAKVKANNLIAKHSHQFIDVFASFHPANLPGEIPGCSSNNNHGLKVVRAWYNDYLAENPQVKNDKSYVYITNLDADVFINPEYFTLMSLKGAMMSKNRRSWCIWQAPLMLFRNYWRVPALIRGYSYAAACFELTGYVFHRWVDHLPFSSFSLTLAFLENKHMGNWDADVICDDHHIGVKGLFASYWEDIYNPKTKGGVKRKAQYHMQPIYLPSTGTMVEGETWWGTIMERYTQARRHMQGLGELSYFALQRMKIAQHSNTWLSFRENIRLFNAFNVYMTCEMLVLWQNFLMIVFIFGGATFLVSKAISGGLADEIMTFDFIQPHWDDPAHLSIMLFLNVMPNLMLIMLFVWASLVFPALENRFEPLKELNPLGWIGYIQIIAALWFETSVLGPIQFTVLLMLPVTLACISISMKGNNFQWQASAKPKDSTGGSTSSTSNSPAVSVENSPRSSPAHAKKVFANRILLDKLAKSCTKDTVAPEINTFSLTKGKTGSTSTNSNNEIEIPASKKSATLSVKKRDTRSTHPTARDIDCGSTSGLDSRGTATPSGSCRGDGSSSD